MEGAEDSVATGMSSTIEIQPGVCHSLGDKANSQRPATVSFCQLELLPSPATERQVTCLQKFMSGVELSVLGVRLDLVLLALSRSGRPKVLVLDLVTEKATPDNIPSRWSEM